MGLEDILIGDRVNPITDEEILIMDYFGVA